MNLRRVAAGLVVGWLGSMGAQQPRQMAAGAHPAFEVATIRPTPESDKRQGFRSEGNRLEIENETVKSMLMFAYGLQHKQITGEPAWVNETAYDVKGVLDVEGEPSTKQWQEILQKLLVERFGLKVHRDKRDLSYFALRVSGTPKLTPAANPDSGADQTGGGGAAGLTMKYTSNTMDEFVIGINYFVDRPMVNETGLEGKWDFTLRWMPDQLKVGDVPADAPPGMTTAIREQLGLKLESAKGPVQVLVVEAVERPSAN